MGECRSKWLTKPDVESDDRDNIEEMSQGAVNNMSAQQQKPETKELPIDGKGSGAVSQSNIDAMIAQHQEQEQKGSEEVILQRELDGVFSQKQSEGPMDERKGVWAGLDQNILSQNEIDALLSGFDEEGPSPQHSRDNAIARGENEQPAQGNDMSVNSRQNHLERQRKKEAQILRDKERATTLIRELLRIEEKRISYTIATKNKMVNKDLFARFEITRQDMTRITVSMSEKTVDEYRLNHPGCCICRI